MSHTRPFLRAGFVVFVSLIMVLSMMTSVVAVGPVNGPEVSGDETGTETATDTATDAGLTGSQQSQLVEAARTSIFDAAERALASRQQMAAGGHLKAGAGRELSVTRTKLQGARHLLAISQTENQTDTLTHGARLAEAGVKLQVAQLSRSTGGTDLTSVDLPAIETPRHASPSGAAFTLFDRYDDTPTAEEAASIRALDDLPEPTRRELTDVLNAFLAYQSVTEHTYGDATQDAIRSGETMRARNDDIARVRSAQLLVLEEAIDFEAALGETSTPGFSGTMTHAQALCFDLSLTTDNTYSTDCVLLIDAGGDDTYTNNAGGASGGHAAALIDISGSDTYNGSNGGGNQSAGLLIDTGTTRDEYYAGGDGTKGEGTNGGGFNTGAGFLFDRGGSDTYEAGSKGTNGGASGDVFDQDVSAGFLLDVGSSNDTYDAGRKGTNGGGHVGTGFLLDKGGGDTYLGRITRETVTGTIYDSQGTNGGGFIGGSGLLVDISGSDTYRGGQSGTNGGGASLGGNGFLLDGSGGDTYDAGSTGGNGGANGGSTASVGFLLDAGLNSDSYTGSNNGVNGGGSVGGIGFLLDGGDKNDTYEADKYGVNGGANGESAGLLLDVDGDNDTYTDDTCGTTYDDTVVPKGTVGAQIDSDQVSGNITICG